MKTVQERFNELDSTTKQLFAEMQIEISKKVAKDHTIEMNSKMGENMIQEMRKHAGIHPLSESELQKHLN